MRYLLATLIALAGCIPTTMMTQTSTQSPIKPASTVRKPPIQTGPVTIQTQTGGNEPTQLVARQMEMRRLEVPYDVAWQAATQAMFTLGYSIEHSEKASGILNGSRMVGVGDFERETGRRQEEFKQKQEEYKQKQKEWKRKVDEQSTLSMIPYVGLFAAMSPTPESPEFPGMDDSPMQRPRSLHMTISLKPLDEKSTGIRFKMQIDGEPAWDPATIDKLWVTTEREAMIEEGPVPPSVAKTDTAPQPPSSASPSPSLEAKETKTAEPTTPPPKGRHNRAKSEKTEAKMTQATTPSSPEVIYVKEPAMTLWDRSGTQPLQIVTLPKGTKLTVLGHEDKWCHVKTEDGREGWVASELTSPQP